MGYLVQAAHIHQHSESGNNDPRIGLALTPDAHWMFDAGLWTAVPKGDHLMIQIALAGFSESSPAGPRLAAYHETALHFHPASQLRPDPAHFEWHRNHQGL